jgi:hypothetical protein
MYENGKMRPVEIILRRGREEVNLSKIYYKHFIPSTTIIQ